MTSTTRRALLRAGAAGLALAPVLVGPDAFAALTTRRGLYVRERFAALKHRTFVMDGREGRGRVRRGRVGNLDHCGPKDAHAGPKLPQDVKPPAKREAPGTETPNPPAPAQPKKP